VQTSTVVGHALTALTYGKPTDLRQLAPFCRMPTLHEWETLTDA